MNIAAYNQAIETLREQYAEETGNDLRRLHCTPAFADTLREAFEESQPIYKITGLQAQYLIYAGIELVPSMPSRLGIAAAIFTK